MKNMSLNVKLWTLCGSLLALLLLVGGVGYRSAAKMESLVKVVQATTQKQGLAASIELAIEKEKVGRREIVLHNDLQYLKNAREEFQQQVDALRPLLTTPTSHRILDQIEAANANYCQSMDEEIQLHQAGKDAQVMELLYGSASQEVREDLKKATGELLNWFGNQAADAEAEELAVSRQATLLTLVFSCLGLVCGTFLATILIRSLIASILPITYAMREIANHNLAVSDVEVTTQDELGQAAAALNAMKRNLSKIVNQIVQSAEQLAAATEEIALSARQSATGAQSEAEQAGQAAAAMQEMSAAVREVASHAQNASQASGRAADAARAGGKVSDETLTTMNDIARSTSHAAESIVELGKSSERIGNIVAVITEIAGQTNLLALNAAIEAARAGEQGRGFAVVAGEVRRLAERTAEATQEVAGMIETIQGGTRLAVEAIERGNLEVELGVRKTNAAGEALNEIIRMSEQVGGMVAQIATAASQQEGASEQINASVSQISFLTQQASANSDQTAAACVNLSTLASDLQRLVNAFRLEQSGTGTGGLSPRKSEGKLHKGMESRDAVFSS
jgi:methyl-accepting chemotaxis protein